MFGGPGGMTAPIGGIPWLGPTIPFGYIGPEPGTEPETEGTEPGTGPDATMPASPAGKVTGPVLGEDLNDGLGKFNAAGDE